MPEHSKFASRDMAHGGPLARQSIFDTPEERDGLSLLADSTAGDSQDKNGRSPEIPDITPQILQLLGPLVAPELREGSGALSLEKLAAKEFQTYAAFKKFLCDQAALNDNKVFRNPYESLLEDDYFVDILSLVYEKLNPAAARLGDSKKAALRMLPEFQSKLVAIDAEAFARHLMKNDGGRQNLKHLLKHPTFLTSEQKADLIKGIYEVADGAKVLSSWERHTVSSNINPWNYFNLGVTEKNLDAAAIGAEFMVGSMGNEEQRAQEIGQDILEKTGPNFKTHDGEGFRQISAERVKHFQSLYGEHQGKTGAKAAAVTKLAHLWLWAADERNMQAYEDLSQERTHQLQHHLMKQAEVLIAASQGLATREDLLAFQEKLASFLQDPIPWKDNNGTVNWVSHQVSGESVEDYLGELPEAYAGVLQGLKRQSEAWDYSVREMDERVRIGEWELAATDPKFKKQIAGMIQGLEESKHQLWYGYKQHKFISRAGSNIAGLVNKGDIQDIEAAQITLNALMQQLSQVKEPEDLKSVCKDLIEELSDEGTLYQAMQAAEMDGTEQMLGLAQTCGIMMGLAAATRGLSLVAEGTGAMARFGGMVRSSRMALDAYGKLGTMTEGAFMGAALVTTENAIAVATGEVRQGPETVGKWFKDAIATGAAMGISAGLLKLPKLEANAQQNLAKQLWARYTTGGMQGLKHLTADMGIEVIEEATDQYIRQVLDGDYGTLTEAEITELTLICFAGGPAKAGILAEHLQAANPVQELNAITPQADEGVKLHTPTLSEISLASEENSKPKLSPDTSHLTPANDNSDKVPKAQDTLPWAAAAGLTAYFTDLNLANATADVGGAIAAQEFWPGLLTALGVAVSGALGMAFRGKSEGQTLEELNQNLLALQRKDPENSQVPKYWAIIADELMEQGDPRGEWIQLELLRDRLSQSGDSKKQLEKIESRIHEIRVNRELDIKQRFGATVALEFKPAVGFSLKIEGDRNSSIDLNAFLEGFFEDGNFAAGVRELTFEYFEYFSLDTAQVNWLPSSPKLSGLTSLNLWNSNIGDAGVRAIAESETLSGLTSLNLWNNNIGEADARAIAESKTLSGLTSLSLGANRIGEAGARAIAESEPLSGLTSLDLWNNQIGDAGARAIAESKTLSGLTSLSLGSNRISVAGAGAIQESPNLPRLKFFNGIKIQRAATENIPTASGGSGSGTLLAAIGVGLTTLLTPEIANATADVGGAIASQGFWPGLLTALGVGAMGLLGMAINRKGNTEPDTPLSTGEQAQLNEILEKFPQLAEALKTSDLSPRQKFQLLSLIAKKGGPATARFYNNVFHLLGALDASDWTWRQKYQILTQLAENAGNRFGRACENLPAARLALEKSGWSSQQAYSFLYDMIKNSRGSVYRAFGMLPLALNALRKTEWTFEQRLQLLKLFEETAEWTVSRVYEYLPSALRALAQTEWNSEEKIHFLGMLATQSGKAAGVALRELSKALAALAESPWAAAENLRYLNSLIEKSTKSAWIVFHILPLLQKYSGQHFEFSLERYSRLQDHLNDYNREKVLLYLNNHQELFATLGGENFTKHLEFYLTLFQRWPRLGFNLLEGVVEATEKGILPHDVTEHGERIFSFIERYHSFIPFLYAGYLREGDRIFPLLEKYSRNMLHDALGSLEVEEILQKHGEEFLLGLIQKTSPTSGASFVQKSNQLSLMNKMIAAGDLRLHIPGAWRRHVETFTLSEGAWKLPAREVADAQGAIREILDEFLTGGNFTPITQQEWVRALSEYLQSERQLQDRKEVQSLLYQYAGQQGVLNETIVGIQANDYTGLILLEQLFVDRDQLPKFLMGAMDQISPQLLLGRGKRKRLSKNPRALVRALNKVWSQQIDGKNLPAKKRLEILASMLKAYEVKAIEKKLLARQDLGEDLKLAIRQVMQASPDLSPSQFMQEILQEPIELIQKEKQKYLYQETQSLRLGIRAVKGPIYGLHGLSSGVCTASDQKLWRNPKFKLLALTDEENIQILGYIQAFEIENNGKKYLTLPGINPSTEFMSRVDAKELYQGIMKSVETFAKAGDYDGVYIPADSIIHSNRRDIHKIIKQQGYPIKNIPIVVWNTLPQPYPIVQVYVAWEKPTKTDSGMSLPGVFTTLGAGLTTLLTPDMANATADVGDAIAAQGFWPGLLTALGVGALGLLGMTWWNSRKPYSLNRLDQELLAWQGKNPHDPKISQRLSMMADQLLEQGDSRGEWLQMALRFDHLKRYGGDPEHMLHIKQRINAIRNETNEALSSCFGFKMKLELDLHRGFTLTLHHTLPENLAEFLQEFSQSPYKILLRGLKLQNVPISRKDLREILNSKVLKQITALTLINNGIEPRGIQSLTGAAQLKNLQRLEIKDNYLNDTGATALAAAKYFANLNELVLQCAGIGWQGARALANSPAFRQLQSLDLSENPFGNLGTHYIAQGAAMKKLQSLNLQYIGINDEGIRALADSRVLKNLNAVKIRGNETGADANASLAASPNLPKLTHINDREIPAE